MILRYDFDMLWIEGYAFDMRLLCFWSGLNYGLGCGWGMVLGIILIWCWYGLGTERLFGSCSRWVGLGKEKAETAPGQAWTVNVSRVFTVLRWFWHNFWYDFWYRFGTILTWFWYDCDMCSRHVQETKQNPHFWPTKESQVWPIPKWNGINNITA